MYRNVAQLPMDFGLFKGYDKPFNYLAPGAIRFGNGVVKETGDLCRELGISKVVISTDPGMIQFGIAKKVQDSLDAAGVEYVTYDKCEANPSVETVNAITELAKDADAIIGIGGGSSIDPAKAASILVTNGGSVGDYEGNEQYIEKPLPVIAIPTSSGTGSEVTCFAMITDYKRKWKMSINGANLVPALAICDPELTATLPAMMTAATGMDALTHAIEGYVSRAVDPISAAIMTKAIALIYKAIRRASFKGEFDKASRYDMMLGSTLAGMGFNNTALGISHVMAHPLGSLHGVPHGVANAICLPVICKFNMYANIEKYADIADMFGKNTVGLTDEEKAKITVDSLFELVDSLPIPPLSTYGVTDDEEIINTLVRDAMKGGGRMTNPRSTTEADFKTLYLETLKMKA